MHDQLVCSDSNKEKFVWNPSWNPDCTDWWIELL